uniref:Uncharacterized protein n=1 Tax=Pseudictyota dubia TaxID=2749911 RepID=A0A7R9W6N5_9STRA|mmetsp:Transcript_35991/g.66345  ORF Transcript_35991/g.66345 Transcript_35991/m.66345 type:complete len:133 (+) Transcript_35991:37-435(+)
MTTKVYYTSLDEETKVVNAESVDLPRAYRVDEKEEEENWDGDGTGRDRGQAKGAAAMCGLFGLLIGGPILAILAAFGGHRTAVHNGGPVGDLSRAFGDVALAAGDAAKESGLKEKGGDAVKSVARGIRESFR